MLKGRVIDRGMSPRLGPITLGYIDSFYLGRDLADLETQRRSLLPAFRGVEKVQNKSSKFFNSS